MPMHKDIRSHINSVQKTRKITNAMHLVSSSRMRKAMMNIERNSAYFNRAIDTMRAIRTRVDVKHPYLVGRAVDSPKTAFIIIAGEKGLSGSYNHDVLKLADESINTHNTTHIFTVGSMASSHLKKMGRDVNRTFEHVAQSPNIFTARHLTNLIMTLYDASEIDELRIVFTRFVNPLVHTPTNVKILPIELESFGADNSEKHDSGVVVYEPSPEEVFHELVPQFIIGYIYGALVHSYASENFARMTAMESATKSADEMIEKLTRQYHSARQVAITNELSEIVGGASMLEGQDLHQ